MSMRTRRARRQPPPDLTSLFVVLFIVIFAALIRAAAAQHAAEAAKPPPPPPLKPMDPASLQARAGVQVAERPNIIVRISPDGHVTEPVVDALLEPSADPDVGCPIAATSARSSMRTRPRRICRSRSSSSRPRSGSPICRTRSTRACAMMSIAACKTSTASP